MRLSEIILRGKALLSRAEPDEEPISMPQRIMKGSKVVRIPNGIRKRFGMAKR